MEEKTVQREDVLGEAIQILEIEGIANTTLEMVAERVAYPLNDLKRFWPDQEALLYDALRYEQFIAREQGRYTPARTASDL